MFQLYYVFDDLSHPQPPSPKNKLPFVGVFLKMDRTVLALLLACRVFFTSNLEKDGLLSPGLSVSSL